mgnify:CR=1 FL=1
MRIRSLTIEDALYLVALGLALGLRLFRLGAAPLTDAEASWALQALGLFSDKPLPLGPQPGYVLLTGLSFAIFSSTNFLARLLPALAGSLLVLLPVVLQPWLGTAGRLRWAGLVLAFGLAVDPGLVALSRTAGSLAPALAFGTLALALFARRWMVAAGIAAGLALLSGPALFHGLLILAVGWGFYRLVEKRRSRQPLEDASDQAPMAELPALQRAGVRSGLVALAGTLLAVGLLFLRAPQGLGALAAALPDYLRGWAAPGAIPALRLPAVLLVYQPVVLLLALLAAWRGWRSLRQGEHLGRLAAGLSLWALAGLVVTMLYPARQVGDLAWVLLPLWGLAALELPHYLPGLEHRSIRLAALGLAILLCILGIVIWVNLLNVDRYQGDPPLVWLVIGGVVILGLISLLMVAAGWSIVSARLGFIWAACILLGVGMFTALWGMTQVRPQGAQELWSTPPAAGQVDLLVGTLVRLSQATTGLDHEIEIALLDPSPSLRWALRQFHRLSSAAELAVTDAPMIVIAGQEQQTPTLAQRYRGQDLVWRVYPAWQSSLPPNFITWLAFRQAPLATQNVILWVRSDLFPGGLESLPAENQPASP